MNEKTIEELEARQAELRAMTDEQLEPLSDEQVTALTEEREAIKAELEARKAKAAEEAEQRKAVAENTAAPVVKEFKSEEKRTMFDRSTAEYRDAFFAMLTDTATAEQRGIFADNTTAGDGIALPVTTDTAIWDQIHTAHPILADIQTIRSGIVMKVTKSTPAAITSKKDSAASSEQTFTNVEVLLAGADYHTYVTLSYAEAKMSQGALESFLVTEVANAIGEALAKDVFARILSDATSAQSVTATSDLFQDVKDALAKATKANQPVIYAPASKYYDVVASIKSGVPFNMGNAVGCQVKLDNAATTVTIVDPAAVVLNVIQDTVIESDKDVKNACFDIGGYMRAEACLRKVKAAAYIA